MLGVPLLLQTGVVATAVNEQTAALEHVGGAVTVTGVRLHVVVVLSVKVSVRLPPEIGNAELAALVVPYATFAKGVEEGVGDILSTLYVAPTPVPVALMVNVNVSSAGLLGVPLLLHVGVTVGVLMAQVLTHALGAL